MKKILSRLSIGALIFAGCTLCADEAAQRRLGDAAFYAGDYLNAISSYKSALLLAEKEGNAEGWAASALNLGVAYLHNGEIAAARDIYDEFRKRFPLRSAGTLPGDLLAAEGKYADAEAFFQSLLSTAPAMTDATNFSLATMYLKTGNLDKACAVFEQLAAKNNSPWQNSALNELLYTLIRLGRPAEAVAKIGAISPEKRNADVELLLYLAEAHSGKISSLKSNFNNFLQKMPPSPHIRLMELLSIAAEVASRSKDYKFATDALNQALRFSVKQGVKQELSRRLIVNLLAYDPDAAAAEVRKYSQTYPDSSDRSQLILSVAGELYKKQMYPLALSLYSFMTEGKFDEADRLVAAAGAAECAEAMKDIAILEKFIRLLIKELPLEEKLQRQFRYAAFLEKNQKYSMAEKELAAAEKTAGDSKNRKLYENALFASLEFYIRRKHSRGINQKASALEKSADSKYRAVANFELGKLMEQASLYGQSRQYFITAAAAGYEKNRSEALFMAALMAYKNLDDATAAAELLAFARQYPSFRKTPEALFMAADIFSSGGDKKRADEAAGLLGSKYSSSHAFAAWVLRHAAEVGKTENFASVIGDLSNLEKKFAGTAAAEEAALLRASLLDRSGDQEAALNILRTLHNSANLSIRGESLLHSGQIIFRQGGDKLTAARELFLRSAAVEPGSLRSDIASGRAGDCVMAGKPPLKTEALNWCISLFDKLAANSRFPQIRLQSFYKAGAARVLAGKHEEAIFCFEKAIYAACDMADQGIIAEPSWCIRSCETALDLIIRYSGEGALQRGLKLIERCEKLSLPEADFTNKMRNNFRKQLQQRR